jgi:hypothetical protein
MSLILSGTNGLSDVDGSAATPAIRGTDTNTGTFFPAADTIAWSTGGTERVRIDSSGNVGIGTSSPSGRLNVAATAATNTTGLNLTGSTTGYQRVLFSNTTGGGQMGVEGSAGGTIATGTTAYATVVGDYANNPLQFIQNNVVRATIDSSGNLLVGTTSSSGRLTVSGGVTSVGTGGSNDDSLAFQVVSSGNTQPFRVYTSANGSANAAAAVVRIQTNGTTGRSINATGTINANGADYAEYMTKAGDFTVAKGDVVGINAQGKLTNVFADAVSFAVKSTNPSYVGGDDWGAGFEEDPEGLEEARRAVDRIAFAGQVPVNVTGATPGQYIVPTDDNGTIKGIAVSSPTFEQYQLAVGKVIAIEADGRARIIVKVA